MHQWRASTAQPVTNTYTCEIMRSHTHRLLMAAPALHRGTAPFESDQDALGHTDPLIHSFNYHMIRIQSRTSTAIQCIYVSLMRGTCVVVYNNGAAYNYMNVSRRAIANLLLNPNMSLGFWVNNNCKVSRVHTSSFVSKAFA